MHCMSVYSMLAFPSFFQHHKIFLIGCSGSNLNKIFQAIPDNDFPKTPFLNLSSSCSNTCLPEGKKETPHGTTVAEQPHFTFKPYSHPRLRLPKQKSIRPALEVSSSLSPEGVVYTTAFVTLLTSICNQLPILPLPSQPNLVVLQAHAPG